MKYLCLLVIACVFSACKPAQQKTQATFKPSLEDVTYAMDMHMWHIEKTNNMAIRLQFGDEDKVFHRLRNGESGEILKLVIWSIGVPEQYQFSIRRENGGGTSGIWRNEIFNELRGFQNTDKVCKLGDTIMDGTMTTGENTPFRLYLGPFEYPDPE